MYASGDSGFQKVPPINTIAAALAKPPAAGGATRSWRATLAVVPGLGVTLLPLGTCPACWPAYAGFLGSLGLGFLLSETYLLPVTAALLVLAVASLAYRARSRYGYGPFVVGSMAAGLALTGKFFAASDSLLYAGLTLLVCASVWNAWPRRTPSAGSCAACVSPQLESLQSTERR